MQQIVHDTETYIQKDILEKIKIKVFLTADF